MNDVSSASERAGESPPLQVTRDAYRDWLHAIGSAPSPFLDPVFDWYDEQLRNPLAPQLHFDPEKIHVDVDRALRETDGLEQAGRVDKGTTVGFECYGLVDVPISMALETALFYHGKPVGRPHGDTYPQDTVFARSHCSIQERWGAGNYFSRLSHTAGGLANDLNDDYTVLVRGNATEGYALFTSFWRRTPLTSTATRALISILMLRAHSGGGSEFRRSVRRNGQNYATFGLKFGRREYGFNPKMIRSIAVLFADSMRELRLVGRIRERRF